MVNLSVTKYKGQIYSMRWSKYKQALMLWCRKLISKKRVSSKVLEKYDESEEVEEDIEMPQSSSPASIKTVMFCGKMLNRSTNASTP